MAALIERALKPDQTPCWMVCLPHNPRTVEKEENGQHFVHPSKVRLAESFGDGRARFKCPVCGLIWVGKRDDLG